MSKQSEWVHALARQARADFRGWEFYQEHPKAVASECHRLLLLQMACEKTCKAYLVNAGADPMELRRSHGYTKAQLPRPLDHSFAPSQLLVLEGGRTFLKTLRSAINRLLALDAFSVGDN
jgi:hypothetical protein